jgi:hypothetical protein
MQAFVPEQVASHAHDSAHRIRLHAPAPEQVIEHGPVPQRSSSVQLPSPLHSIVHAVAILQSTWWPHDWSPHTTRHGTPAGQITSFGHVPVALQSSVHTPFAQVPLVHTARHAVLSGPSGPRSGGGSTAPSLTASQRPATSGAAHQPSSPHS